MAVIALVGLVLKLSGAWDWLKGKVSGFADAVMAKIQPVIDKVMALWNTLKQAGSAVGNFLGFGGGGGGEGAPAGGTTRIPADGSLPIMTPGDAVSNSFQQSMVTNKAEVTIKDETGRAQVTQEPKSSAFSLNLKPSGAF
jgi:hypothetical protein